MAQKEAVIETLKHFGANLVAGILHSLIGFSISLIIGAFIPVQVPINTIQQLIGFAGAVGLGSGILGAVLAVENEGDDFQATRVLRFVREAVYPSSRNNGSKYTLSTSLGWTIHRKKAWQDYIFYI